MIPPEFICVSKGHGALRMQRDFACRLNSSRAIVAKATKEHDPRETNLRWDRSQCAREGGLFGPHAQAASRRLWAELSMDLEIWRVGVFAFCPLN